MVLSLGIFAISYLQYRFDQSDLKHALAAVRLNKSLGPEDLSLEQKIASHYQVPIDSITWLAHIESKVRGFVRVEAKVVNVSDLLNWDVDLVRFQVIPVSEMAKQIGHINKKQ